jgi:hypothetical protein
MRWRVEAADAKTGLETEMTIEALTEAEAERLARYNGLLVSRISKDGYQPAPVVPYAKPAVPDERTSDVAAVALVRRARSTQRLGLALATLGWVMLSGGVGLFGYVALRHGWGDWANWRAWLPAAAAAAGPAWRLAAGGTAAVAAGSALRLLAAMALALRPARRGRGDSALPDKFRLNVAGDAVI